MLENFVAYLELGFRHIANLDAYDHLVFVLVLCAPYSLAQWKELLFLVTAFTIGHSITLVLATFQIILLPTSIVEFCIPLTIFFTALYNFYSSVKVENNSKLILRGVHYFFTLFFGLIHGLGFSNFLRSLLGKSSDIISALLAFNIGLEVGQLMIIAIIFGSLFVLNLFFRIVTRDWNLFASGMAAGIALILMTQTKFW